MSAVPVAKTRLYTQDDLIEFDAQGYRYELIKGELIPMSPTSRFHGSYSARLAGFVIHFVEENDLGEYYIAEAGFVLSRNPDTVLTPDFAYIRNERVKDLDTEGFVSAAPDLVLETRSPSDSLRALRQKMQRWMSAGTKLGWLLEPEARRLTVYRPGAEPLELGPDDTLTGGDVLPGFTLLLTRLFR